MVMESTMFRELPGALELETEVSAFWRDSNIFEASLARSRGRPRFVFYEGPPTANGTPHNGHVLTRVIKDLFPRYRTLRGYHVERKAGWDTHGLPVEVEVEKELNMRAGFDNSRDAVAAYGLDNFSRRCIESVFRYTNDWEELTSRVGFWVDMPSAYVTYHKSYVESVWWALKTLFARGLLYQGEKVVWWWPEGGTALSAGEVGEGYRDVDDPSVTVRLRVVGEPGTSLLAWTTTPWTLPSNVALAVGADLDYAYVQLEDEVVIVADALKPAGDVLRVVKGRELVGLRYEPLYTLADPGGRSYEVVAGAHVNLDAGTGIVHTAPAYGEDDHELRRLQGLGIIAMVGATGRFGADAPEWLRGLHFKAADKPIMRDLRERGLLYEAGTIRHSYPFSPRSKEDALFQLARPGWFIRTTDFKEQALANNDAVGWLPEHIQEGRFGDFLRNNVDWALSRERFWGTPLPIWTCAACGKQAAFDSVAELRAHGATGFADSENEHLQVHKPWIDQVVVPCKGCGTKMERVPEVIDCWFDSGCMPFAQHGFPHQGVEEFKASFPADFISEAVDQTRGWFYSLLMISTMLFDDDTCRNYGIEPVGFPRPFKNCIVLGHVTDMDGKKESKSTGNYTSPDLVLRGRMRQKLVADPSLARGTLGMVKAGVRSIDLASGERLTASIDEQGAGITLAVEPVAAGPYGKDTVALHPDDIAALGLDTHCWLSAPFDPPGADAFRWLFYANNPPWNNTRISLRNIREGQREFHLRLANVFQFFTIYANINGFQPSMQPPSDALLDRWVRVERDSLVRTVTELLDNYRIYEAARAISDFVDALSNWYVRRSRTRFWGDGDEPRAALATLYEVLASLTVVISPFVPFMAEAMHQRLGLPGVSVHLGDWPAVGAPAPSDMDLQQDMALVRELASLGLAARARVGVRVRQPLQAAEIILADPNRVAGLQRLLPLLQEELNVREIHFTQDAERFVEFKIKPDYPRLGKRLGKEMKACAAALGQVPGADVRKAVLAGGYTVELPSGPVVLTGEDVVVEVQPRAHFQAAGSASAVVVLHADLDDDLREEGLARELLSRLQTRRKELDLGYTARIDVELRADGALAAAATRFTAMLQAEALAVALRIVPAVDPDLDVDGNPCALVVTPVGP
jgi:isoleucyl-tRNA synthetase